MILNQICLCLMQFRAYICLAIYAEREVRAPGETNTSLILSRKKKKNISLKLGFYSKNLLHSISNFLRRQNYGDHHTPHSSNLGTLSGSDSPTSVAFTCRSGEHMMQGALGSQGCSKDHDNLTLILVICVSSPQRF